MENGGEGGGRRWGLFSKFLIIIRLFLKNPLLRPHSPLFPMENGGEGGGRRWGFGPNAALTSVATMSIPGTLNRILSSVDEGGRRPVVPLGHGDPSAFPFFRTTLLAEDAVVAAVSSAQFNSYSSAVGVLSARSAIAEYLSRNLPYNLSSDDIFLTGGCTQAIEVKLNLSCLEDIHDDVDFCSKLAKEESVIILPGSAMGMKNWLRVTFAIDPSSLEDGLDRLKSFSQRHAKKSN